MMLFLNTQSLLKRDTKMKKTLILLFTMIIVLSLLKIAAATPITYDFCLGSGLTHEALSIFFPGDPNVTATGWGGEFTHPDTSENVAAGDRKVHQCEFGLGVMSFDDGEPSGDDDDQHAIDGWIPDPTDKTHGHGGGGSHIYVEEKLYLEFSQEVTINSITFTRVDVYDEFSLSVDGLDVHIFHIKDSFIPGEDDDSPAALDFEDFITVNLADFYTGTTTGTRFGISTTEGCDDFKVARISADPIPEPGTIFLLFFGLLGMIGFKKKFKKM